jgi:hypothetical protein
LYSALVERTELNIRKYGYLTFNFVRDEQFYTTLVANLKVRIYFSDVFLREERHFNKKGTKYVNSKQNHVRRDRIVCRVSRKR